MVNRRIKRNFEEQLSAVSSLTTHIPQNRTNDETKSKCTWHRNRVWHKDDPQTRVEGDPKVNNLHERPTKVKIDSKPNKKRTWHCNRVWRKDDPQTQVGGDPKDILDRPTKVNVNDQLQNDEKLVKEPHRKSGPRRWRYNRIWRRDFVWKKEVNNIQFVVF
ncbi:uncharacterized protein LOC128164783 [Crassostrea angulata]|uniref:uncharacterized protein LOC128164783 n=1 Tax=Magallana angulata TaxID=2784310 RepID=UPI0022B0C370|nr:uncharacterized protein LOC128164783 [Crassostrea angulata]